ncbi:MAG: 4Fe-4S binding protein [Candidatus Sabulitectum sp.]|nr:4Fe-4S binding protein [Candidatus Sabulitectum sp.]
MSVANIAGVDPDVCKGCGSCSTVCSSNTRGGRLCCPLLCPLHYCASEQYHEC